MVATKAKRYTGLGVAPELAKEIARPALKSTATVSATPTDAELDSAFGQPADVGAGFIGLVDDNLVISDGSAWRFVALTTAS